MGRYGASFRLYFRQQIWATNPYLKQQIYNKHNEKKANKQKAKEYKVKKNSNLTIKGR